MKNVWNSLTMQEKQVILAEQAEYSFIGKGRSNSYKVRGRGRFGGKGQQIYCQICTKAGHGAWQFFKQFDTQFQSLNTFDGRLFAYRPNNQGHKRSMDQGNIALSDMSNQSNNDNSVDNRDHSFNSHMQGTQGHDIHRTKTIAG